MLGSGTVTNAWIAVCFVLVASACTANTDDENQAGRLPIFNDPNVWDVQPRVAPLRRVDDDPPVPPDEDPPPEEEPPAPEPDAGTGGGGGGPFPFPTPGGDDGPYQGPGGGVYEDPPEPPTIVTVHSAQELSSALGVAQPNTVIEIPEGVSIDLTNVTCGVKPPPGAPDTAECHQMFIPTGVTLRGTRGRLNEGALIFTTRMRDHRFFDVAGDFVTIEGLRFRGPSRDKDEGQPEVMGVVIPAQFTATIKNNEFSDFTSSAVHIRGSDNLFECQPHQPGRSNRQFILNNYMHHNQRRQRGYGVDIHDGAFSFIAGNTFDANRHSIAADGNATTGYRAFDNLVLSGGGEYCDYAVACWYEHLFDMHGTAGAPHYDGGIAGDFVDIGWNTFRGAQSYGVWPLEKVRAAYNVRGTPCDYHTFHNNVLLHGSMDAALRNSSTLNNVHQHSNQLGIDWSKRVLVGDLDADGHDDLFVGTGAAWYYSSGALTEWRFLVRRPEPTSALRIGNFDNDPRADIFRIVGDQWQFSSAGVGPWTNLNGGSIPLEDLRFGDFDADGFTDIFRANGSKWFVSWGGVSGWDEINVSVYGVDALGFGDFDGSGTTDVFGVTDGQWSVSWSGSTGWQRLRGTQYMNLDEAVFADFDGNGVTDIMYSKITGSAVPNQSTVSWYLAHDGVGTWSRVANFQAWSSDPSPQIRDHFVGNFDGVRGAEALRYNPPTSVGSAEGNWLMRWLNNQAYTTYSRNEMR